MVEFFAVQVALGFLVADVSTGERPGADRVEAGVADQRLRGGRGGVGVRGVEHHDSSGPGAAGGGRLEAGREGVERLHPGGPGRLGRVRFRGGLAAQVEHAEPAADLPELVGGVQHGLAGQRVRASGLLKSGVGQRVKFALVLREADDDVVAAVGQEPGDVAADVS